MARGIKYSTDEERKEARRAATRRWRAANPTPSRKDAPISDERKAVLRERDRLWRKNNPRKAVAAALKWAAKNPDRVRKNNAKHRSQHREEARRRTAEWRKANPDRYDKKRLSETSARHYEKNKDRLRVAHKLWKEANKHAMKESYAKRRAILKGSQGSLSRGIVRKLFEDNDGLCRMCSTSLVEGFHLDHIIPISRGGRNSDDNVQLLCPTCNLRKGRKMPHEIQEMSLR